MSQSDELNVELLRLYAWKLGTGDAPLQVQVEDQTQSAATSAAPPVAAPEPGTVDDEVPSPATLAADRIAARDTADELAAAIERLFASTRAGDEKCAELEALLATTAQSGLAVVSLGRHPRPFVRLARLCNRYWPTLTEATRDSTLATFFWMPLDHPELAELLCEIATTGNWALGQRISIRLAFSDPASEKLTTFRGALAPRLLEILRRADSLPHPNLVRLLIVDWLGLDLLSEAVAPLRALVRLPHLGVRWRALDLLLDGFRPSPLHAEDVLFLLHDLLVRAPQLKDDQRYEEAMRYADSLQRAVVKLRPPGGAELLEQIWNRGHEFNLRFTDCNEAWALYTMSGAYPEYALPFIDSGLCHSTSHFRLLSVQALARLPEELCRPRLLAAASDASPRVAERAQELWLERYDGLCPVEPLAGFPVALLPGPPSEHFFGRLAVLRSPSEEARQAMVQALLAEAPAQEALCLLVFALGDDTLLLRNRRRLPKTNSAMVVRLYRRFGAPAITALCWLSERYPRGGFIHWFSEMNQLATAGGIRKRDLAPLRNLALRWLEHPHSVTRDQAFRALRNLGIPEDRRDELRERMLALLSGEPHDSERAASLLQVWGSDAALDQQLVESALAAFAARDGRTFSTFAELGFLRRLPVLTTLAAEILASWLAMREGPWPANGAATDSSEKPTDLRDSSEKPTSPGDPSWPPLALVHQSCSHLFSQGRLTTDWILSALRAPETAAFRLAAHLQRHRASEDARAALFAVLDPAIAGRRTAEVAAVTLLDLSAIAPSDPRLEPLLATADRDLRRMLLFETVFRSPLRPGLSPFLLKFVHTATLGDAEDLERALRMVILGSDEDRDAVYSLLTTIPDLPLRAALLERFPAAAIPRPLWLDDADVLSL